ncbi:MAG: hypothetical protein AAF696_13625 [Bacteroidota bacterium]
MNIGLPPETSKIYEWLSKGQFLNSHSANQEQEYLYRLVNEHFDTLVAYFQPIGFRLERGENYVYFSRLESKASLEEKLPKLYRHIDILDFFLMLDPAFGPGTRFYAEEWLIKIKEQVLLKRKLKRLEARGEQETEKLKRILDHMIKEGFLELEQEKEKCYRVLPAIQYLQELIDRIQLEE